MVSSESPDMLSAATAPLTFHDFLERMRHPSAADLVRSIKSFIVQFMSRQPDGESDSASVREFLSTTEQAFRAHPLWAGASEEELEAAGEGLEKYLMTKLFPRAFAPSPEEVERDRRLSDKIAALQQFVRPEQLDIPAHFTNEASWLLAQKELQKMGSYKAPRDKLVCVLNCCRVVTNLLLNAALGATGEATPPGADDFLPVLIYVLIKANPPQLQSNVDYIQRYRHHTRLVSESAYFFTNLVSAASFLENISASSLSMSEPDFNASMQAAYEVVAANASLPAPPSSAARGGAGAQGKPSGTSGAGEAAQWEAQATLEAELARDHPFVFTRAGDLRVSDVEALLQEYKELVLRYAAVCRTLKASAVPATLTLPAATPSHALEAAAAGAQAPWEASGLDQSGSAPESSQEQGAAHGSRGQTELAAEGQGAGATGGEDPSLNSSLFEGLSLGGVADFGAEAGGASVLEDLAGSEGKEVQRDQEGNRVTTAEDIPDDLRALEEALAQSGGSSPPANTATQQQQPAGGK